MNDRSRLRSSLLLTLLFMPVISVSSSAVPSLCQEIISAASHSSGAAEHENIRRLRVTGAGTGSDTAKARDAALNDALRRAVEEGLGVLVDARTRTSNYQLIQDEVLTHSRGFVRWYRILSEGIREGAYHIQIEADVALTPLEESVEHLADRLKFGSDPRIVLLLQGVEREYSREAAEEAESQLTEALTDSGFTVRDVETANQARLRDAISHILDGSADSAARRVLMPVADILIVGRVSVRDEGRIAVGGERFWSASARCDLSVIHADTGNVITRFSASAPRQISGIGSEQAAEKAVRKASSLWLEKSLGKLVRAAVDPMRVVTVTLQEVRLVTLESVTDYLRALRTVRRVRLRDQARGLTTIDVEWLGEAADLAQELERSRTLHLQVLGHTTNTVLLASTAKARRP